MSYQNGIITAPVPIPDDVNAVLGTNYHELNDFCTSENINKFARYKPVKYPKIEYVTDAMRRSVGHGISLPNPVTLAGSIFGQNSDTYNAIMAACELDWGYTPPSGGTAGPFRLGDFGNWESRPSQGYYHYAVPPIQVNYPRDGWTFLRGSNQNRTLVISIDLDPDDSAINLQSYDLTEGTINLNEWTLIAYIDNPYMTDRIYASDDPILDSGEIAGNTIAIQIPNGTGSYDCDVYICMYRFNNSTNRYEFLPLPKQGDYNPEYYTLHVIDDAQSSGGGISGDDTEEMFNQVLFSPSFDGVQLPTNLPEGYPSRSDFPEGYVSAWWTTDNGVGKLCMRCNGSLYVKMTLTNTSTSTKNLQRSAFQLDLNGLGPVSATHLYDSSKTQRDTSGVNIAGNGGTATIYLEFDAIFPRIGGDWNNSNKNSSWSMDFTRDGATLFGGDIYAMKGSDGWVARSN